MATDGLYRLQLPTRHCIESRLQAFSLENELTLYQQVYDYLQNDKYPDEFSKSQKRGLRWRSQDFVVQDGVLFYQGKNKESQPRRWITELKQKQQILEGYHSSQLAGHFGRDKRREKAIKNKVWHRIGIDLIGPLPETHRGNKYLMTCTDSFSKWPEAKPLKDKTAIGVADFLYELLTRYGVAEVIISDQGREFVNQINEELFRLTGTDHRISSAYHPQTNGLDEHMNQTIKTCHFNVISNCLAKGFYKLVKDGKELKKSYNGVRLKKYAKPSTVNDAAGSRSKDTVNPNVWLPGLGLTAKDKETIQNNSKLDDKVINAAQTVLKQQFPSISG
ncbi:retrotransposable element [Paramuricea clavata]|uniref:Retrotransposable element n=1 Tax=Paramuricea clavata TaxID=317549 RepID=A0A7D9EGC9_PARCT|nr:retrotransposable element [Paramuricea clavata]